MTHRGFEMIIHKTDRLRKLILEHPGLPLMVFAGETAWDGVNAWTTCTEVRAEVGEFLACDGPNDEIVYLDREELREDVEESMYDGREDMPEEDLEALYGEEMARYEPFWTPCIILWVEN